MGDEHKVFKKKRRKRKIKDDSDAHDYKVRGDTRNYEVYRDVVVEGEPQLGLNRAARRRLLALTKVAQMTTTETIITGDENALRSK